MELVARLSFCMCFLIFLIFSNQVIIILKPKKYDVDTFLLTWVYSLPSPKTRGKIRLVLNSCRIHAEFMLISCWFHFQPEFAQCFVQQLRSDWCWIHVEFMLNSCWFHADFIFTLVFTMLCATLCITMVLNSCWIHAEFMLNSSNSVKIYVFYNFSSFFEKSQTVFLIVYSMNNPVKCFKCHFIWQI